MQCGAHLGSWHGREGVGGSENRLVVHHGLGSHHWDSAHLTHLGRDLAEDEERGDRLTQGDPDRHLGGEVAAAAFRGRSCGFTSSPLR